MGETESEGCKALMNLLASDDQLSCLSWMQVPLASHKIFQSIHSLPDRICILLGTSKAFMK